MAKAEQYAQWIVDNKAQQGSKEFETVAAAYKEAKQLESQPESYSMLESAGRGAAQGATLSLGDEMSAGVESAYDSWNAGTPTQKAAGALKAVANPLQSAVGAFMDKDVQERYDPLVEEQRAKNKKAETDNPASFVAGDLAGGMLVPAGVGNLLKGTKVAKYAGKGMDRLAKTKAVKGLAKGKKYLDDKVSDASKYVTSQAEGIPIIGNLAKSKNPKLSAAEDVQIAAKKSYDTNVKKYREDVLVAKARVRSEKADMALRNADGKDAIAAARTRAKTAKAELKAANDTAKAAYKKEVVKAKEVAEKTKVAAGKVKTANKVKKDDWAAKTKVVKDKYKSERVRYNNAMSKFKANKAAMKAKGKVSKAKEPVAPTMGKLPVEPKYKTVPAVQKPVKVKDPKPADRRKSANADQNLKRKQELNAPDRSKVTAAQDDLNNIGSKVPNKGPLDDSVEKLRQSRLDNKPVIDMLPQTTGEAAGAGVGGLIGSSGGPMGAAMGANAGVKAVKGAKWAGNKIANSKTAGTAARLAGLATAGQAGQAGVSALQGEQPKKSEPFKEWADSKGVEGSDTRKVAEYSRSENDPEFKIKMKSTKLSNSPNDYPDLEQFGNYDARNQ